MKKNRLNIILILIITFLVLYFALKDNYSEILSLLMQADVRWLFLGVILTFGYCLFKSIILNDIVKQYKPHAMKEIVNLQLMTFFFNAITPFSSGGQPFQVYMLKKNGIPVSKGTNVIVQETILHQCSMLILSILALILNGVLNIIEFNDFIKFLFVISFIINTVVLILLFIMAYAKKLDKFVINMVINLLHKFKVVKNKEKLFTKWNNSVESFHESSKILLSSKRRFIKLILLNMMGLISLYIVPLVILFGLGGNSFDGLTAIVLIIFVSIMSSFVPLPGATGGQEYLFILLFGFYVSNPILSSLMILWRFLTYYVPMIVGAIVFNIQKRKF